MLRTKTTNRHGDNYREEEGMWKVRTHHSGEDECHHNLIASQQSIIISIATVLPVALLL
jgi:hypothetical protein